MAEAWVCCNKRAKNVCATHTLAPACALQYCQKSCRQVMRQMHVAFVACNFNNGRHIVVVFLCYCCLRCHFSRCCCSYRCSCWWLCSCVAVLLQLLLWLSMLKYAATFCGMKTHTKASNIAVTCSGMCVAV